MKQTCKSDNQDDEINQVRDVPISGIATMQRPSRAVRPLDEDGMDEGTTRTKSCLNINAMKIKTNFNRGTPTEDNTNPQRTYLQNLRNVYTPSTKIVRRYDTAPTVTMGAAVYYDKVATYEKDQNHTRRIRRR